MLVLNRLDARSIGASILHSMQIFTHILEFFASVRKVAEYSIGRLTERDMPRFVVDGHVRSAPPTGDCTQLSCKTCVYHTRQHALRRKLATRPRHSCDAEAQHRMKPRSEYRRSTTKYWEHSGGGNRDGDLQSHEGWSDGAPHRPVSMGPILNAMAPIIRRNYRRTASKCSSWQEIAAIEALREC